MKKISIIIISLLITISSKAQWSTTLSTPPTAVCTLEVEIPRSVNANAWINTYSSICIPPSPGDQSLPGNPITNHIRMSQIGKYYGEINDDPITIFNTNQSRLDCSVQTDFYFKTEIFNSKLILDFEDNSGNAARFMSFWRDNINIHQKTTFDNDIIVPNIYSTTISTNSINAATANISTLAVNDLTVSNFVLDKLAIGGPSSLGANINKKSSGTVNGVNYSDYALSVNGTIISRKEIVQATSWADKVFAKDYQLMSLHDIEMYVNKHKHLPEIPSESEVIENGVDLGEMNKLLLQKVEELTLHLIEQDKKIKSLETKLETLK